MIEILYRDICNLNGDNGNIMLIEQTFGIQNIVYTKVNDTPYFVNHDIDMLYMASTSEAYEPLIIQKLQPFKEALEQLIKNNKVVLLTGNAINIFAKKIIDGKNTFKGLGILDIVVNRDYKQRHNCLVLGKYNDLNILGFKSQFMLLDNKEESFMKVEKGFGNNLNEQLEGVKKNNLYATTLLGPLLTTNIYLTREIFDKISSNIVIPFEEQMIYAYEYRLKEYNKLTSSKIIH
ncbi:MAG: hypothetical protein WBO70_01480 [Erysipelotrichaceae bacterium]